MSKLDYSVVVANIRKELKTYLQKSGLKSLVLGISGGIDSTICVALAKPVCDELGVTIYGRFISIQSNKPDEVDRARLVGKAFCHDYNFIDLSYEQTMLATSFDINEGEIKEDIANKIRLGNIKARLRMIYIYNMAQLHNGMVLSTDNYTELLLGFWTLHGDVGDYGMVQNLWKSEIYEMSRWVAENETSEGSFEHKAIMSCVDAVPTDGLGITNSDLEQLGARTYEEVDEILKQELKKSGHLHAVAQRKRASEFKRENPYNLPRDIICKGAE